jgi:hypothetical protein
MIVFQSRFMGSRVAWPDSLEAKRKMAFLPVADAQGGSAAAQHTRLAVERSFPRREREAQPAMNGSWRAR